MQQTQVDSQFDNAPHIDTAQPTSVDLSFANDYLICCNCGTQYREKLGEYEDDKEDCRICDDARFYLHPSGLVFTTLSHMHKSGYKNVWHIDPVHQGVMFITTYPPFAMNRRACLICTPQGQNFLWDLVPFLDEETIARIQSLGGLSAIILPSPHSYATYATWARAFGCEVFVSYRDRFYRQSFPWHVHGSELKLPTTLIGPENAVVVLIVGGPFPGSMVMLYDRKLFLSDTVATAASAFNPRAPLDDTISYAFIGSRANYTPLHHRQILAIWKAISEFDFDTTFGAFANTIVRTTQDDVQRRTGDVKSRFLSSCKQFIAKMGYGVNHEIMRQRVFMQYPPRDVVEGYGILPLILTRQWVKGLDGHFRPAVYLQDNRLHYQQVQNV